MTRKQSKQAASRPHRASRQRTPPVESPGIPGSLRVVGMLLLMVATGASLVLALDHFALATPPGCGPQSGCDQATRSVWGTIPGVNWPTSLFGVAYFGGLMLAWMLSSRGISSAMRAMVWLGAAASVFFVIIMWRNGYVCRYCLAAHVANGLFVIVMEIAASKSHSSERSISRAPLRAGMVAFIILTIGLGIVHVQTSARRLARSEADRREATDLIAARSGAESAGDDSTSTTQRASDEASDSTQSADPRPPFTGRWRLGPERAPIRIVMFTDYQCPDCKVMESQAMALLQRRNDVSLSIKHFPMCAQCNPHTGGNCMHPNACWAARAAETAGMLKGNDGFWQMHDWLFERSGSFTDQNLPPELVRMGYDPQQFQSIMQSNQTFQTVLSDIDEGYELGLHFTPMIFINGVELRGFINNPGALTRTVEELAARNLPPGDAAQDHPVGAVEKLIEDWRLQPLVNIASDSTPHVRGKDSAAVRFTLWGDLQDSFTAAAHDAIMQAIADGRDISYEFRHFPADQSCNPHVLRTAYPTACVAARAAEAAAALNGEEAYWRMHDWLLANRAPLNDAVLRNAAAAVGLDADALLAKMNDPSIAAAIAQDVASGRVYAINAAVPTLYVNGRRALRWKLGNATIIPQLIDAATSQ